MTDVVGSRTCFEHRRVARTLIEGCALVAGALLGGALGLGTALFALTIGPAVQLFFRLLRMDETGATRRA
ncbi:MAG: hypothetical protein M3333_00020 [Actinomycetota bacterium]|nr:hypothetical protein [Actinomycetota bacterium]